MSGKSTAEQVLGQPAQPLVTAYTISLADPDTMAAKTAENAGRPLLKIKTGTADDEARLRAVRAAAPEARIIIDANEGWNDDNIEYYLKLAAELKISLIEQPLPAGKDAILARIDHPVLICADESVHSTEDLAGLRDRYDAINIKLDKTGGLTEALVMKAEAERLGFTIMVGCMLGTSLGMAPPCWSPRARPLPISTGRCCWLRIVSRGWFMRVRWFIRRGRNCGGKPLKLKPDEAQHRCWLLLPGGRGSRMRPLAPYELTESRLWNATRPFSRIALIAIDVLVYVNALRRPLKWSSHHRIKTTIRFAADLSSSSTLCRGSIHIA